jgi:hypothetical protein
MQNENKGHANNLQTIALMVENYLTIQSLALWLQKMKKNEKTKMKK